MIADSLKAIQLDPNSGWFKSHAQAFNYSVKGEYYLGQAYLELNKITEALLSLKKGFLITLFFYHFQAYTLAIKQRTSLIEDIADTYRRAKKASWENNERERKIQASEFFAYMTFLIESEHEAKLKELSDNPLSKEYVKKRRRDRLNQLDDLYAMSKEPEMKVILPYIK